MKKKLALFLTAVLVIGLSVIGLMHGNKTYAKEAEMRLEVSKSVKKENEFTVKVILNSDVNLYSIDAYLSYNADLLEFVPDNELVTGSAGVLELKDIFAEETKNAEYELTFKALGTGKAEIALTDVYLIDYADLDYIEVVPSAKRFDIGINKKEETDARLSELLVAPGVLEEPFSPEKKEYELHVGLDIEMIGISAIPMDEGSVVELDMPEKLVVGENIVTITVTSLSGKVNTYIVKVYREEMKEEVTEGLSEDVTEEVTENESEEITEEVTESVSEEITEEVTENTSEDNTEEVTEHVSEEITEKVAEADSAEAENIIE